MHTRTMTLAAVALASSLTGAVAADKGGPRTVAEAIAAPAGEARTWTGCHVGIAGGLVNATVADLIAIDGTSIGVTGGCDFQLDRRFVAGAFVDYDQASLDLLGYEIDGDGWALGARAGYLVNADTLLYGLIAYRAVELEIGANTLDLEGTSFGAGVETRLTDRIGARLEYRHTRYDEDESFGGLDVDDDTVRLALTYNFGFARLPSEPAFK